MLFKLNHLQGIKSGEITLAFRKWQKPCVRIGTQINTAIGLIEIRDIQSIDEKDITNDDATNAGYSNKEQLLKSLSAKTNGVIFKITVAFYSEDPRIKLREQTVISEQELDAIIKKLNSLDRYSKNGEWTIKVLKTIQENPNLHAIGIANLTGFEKEWLKLNIRKLKNLGLTISHTVGYELSPKGNVLLNKLIKQI